MGISLRALSGLMRTTARKTSSGMNVNALMRKPQPGPKATTTKPATAGPTTCENWRAVELRLTAERSFEGPTIA